VGGREGRGRVREEVKGVRGGGWGRREGGLSSRMRREGGGHRHLKSLEWEVLVTGGTGQNPRRDSSTKKW